MYLPIKVKGCPFCGRYPEVRVEMYDFDRKAQVSIRCSWCFVSPYCGEIRDVGYWDNAKGWVVFRTPEEAQQEALYTAARHWNARVVIQ